MNCSLPEPPLNGSVSNYSRGITGASLRYGCDEGFVPSALRMSVCSGFDNIWIPSPDQHNCTQIEGINFV